MFKKQAEETASLKAEIASTEVQRTQGARRAAGVFAGQGDGVNVTTFTAVPEVGDEPSCENFHFNGNIDKVPAMLKLGDDLNTMLWAKGKVEKHAIQNDVSTTYLCNTEEGGTLENKSVAMNAVLCLLVNGLIDEPQQHSLTVIATLLGMDNENINEHSLADVGERLHARGYVWYKWEAEEHFDFKEMKRLYQIKEHLQQLWRNLLWMQAESGFKINMHPTSGQYTYEYEHACNGDAYNKDGSSDGQSERKTVGQAVRDRNQLAADSKEAEATTAVAYPEEKHGEPEPFTVFNLGKLDEIVFRQDEDLRVVLTKNDLIEVA